MGKFEQPRGRRPDPPQTKRKEASPRSRRRTGGAGKGWIAGLIAGAAVLGALAVGTIGYAYSVAKSDAIFPNVYVAGVDVGGMTKEEAVEAVQSAVDRTYGTSELVVKLPDRTLSFGPELTKISLDVAGAVDEAWSYGRDKGVFEALRHKLKPGNSEQFINIEQSLTLDEESIQSSIDEAAASVKSERKDSKAEIITSEQPDGTMIPTELVVNVGSSSRSLDADLLYDLVVSALMNNDYTPIEFDYDETAYSPVDLDVFYDELCTDMKDAYYDDESKSIVDEIEGYGFDLAAAKQRQAMAEEGSTLTIELDKVKPAVTRATLEQKLFADVLAQYDSPHVANWARTTNLKLACEAIDGTVLNAGDVFSFNDTVGERTFAKGYQAATVYVQGDSVPEAGGGVCQVASTIYVCCILADLNVVERSEHMFLVDYVPRGADATIYWGALDFKFENSTPYPLRIDASVSDGYVHIKLIGTKENDETIELIPETTATVPWQNVEEEDEEKPEGYKEVTQTPYTGYAVTLYIQRKDANGNPIGGKELAQHPYSRYSKRDRVTVIGTKKEEEEEPPEELDPTVPVDPTIPVDPTVPVDPTIPVDPATPAEPDTPPVEPDTPPVEPDTPPVEPDTPPVEPETPPDEPINLPDNPFEDFVPDPADIPTLPE